ncbi:MAG: carbonic anhydrase [Polyangiaceae bacterium]
MGLASRLALSLLVSISAAACSSSKPPAATQSSEKRPAAYAPAPVATHTGSARSAAAKKEFPMPFSQQTVPDESLSRAQLFLGEALAANAVYGEHGEGFFAAFADKQHPRATVVTCADSRVAAGAWDATPENDDFTIRNIGNQLSNSEGSVEYGVEELGTPVLFIVGHTGCGAIKARMGDMKELPKPIQKELASLHAAPAAPAGKSAEEVWSLAVIANVHDQVATALSKYPDKVMSGALTVVGAVYDFRNDLHRGAGKLLIVDVNGHSDDTTLSAFANAVRLAPYQPVADHPHKEKGKHTRGDVEALANTLTTDEPPPKVADGASAH